VVSDPYTVNNISREKKKIKKRIPGARDNFASRASVGMALGVGVGRRLFVIIVGGGGGAVVVHHRMVVVVVVVVAGLL
jgi:hypothetical protein